MASEIIKSPNSTEKVHRPYKARASKMTDQEAVAWLVMIASDLEGEELTQRIQELQEVYLKE